MGDVDESFKRPGAVPFKWEIQPGIPKPNLCVASPSPSSPSAELVLLHKPISPPPSRKTVVRNDYSPRSSIPQYQAGPEPIQSRRARRSTSSHAGCFPTTTTATTLFNRKAHAKMSVTSYKQNHHRHQRQQQQINQCSDQYKEEYSNITCLEVMMQANNSPTSVAVAINVSTINP